MTSKCRPCSDISRRALARISSTPIEALSSMKTFASDNRPSAADSWP